MKNQTIMVMPCKIGKAKVITPEYFRGHDGGLYSLAVVRTHDVTLSDGRKIRLAVHGGTVSHFASGARVGDFKVRNKHNAPYGGRWFGYYLVDPKTGYRQRAEYVLLAAIDRYGFDRVIGIIEKADRINPTAEGIL